jgi:citrate lyase subunit beta/citryl-CoA lyase
MFSTAFTTTFAPTEEEVSWSRKIIAAFEDPANARKGVIELEGKMVERLHRVMARRTVAIADTIEAMRKTEEDWF